MQGYEFIREIDVFDDGAPITFAHRRFVDNNSQHLLHINNHCEIYVFISGDADYIVEDNYYELERGDIILINPLEVHKAVLKSECMYERFYLLLTADSFPHLLENPLAGLLSKPNGERNLIRFEAAKREEMLALLYGMRECVESVDRLSFLSKLIRFLVELSAQLSDAAPSREPSADKLLSEIMGYIDKNATTLESLSQAASELGISPQYMSSYFSRRVGTTLASYLQAKRISIAKQLLDSGADVTAACYESGFNDCSYFIRVFRRFVGMTPLKYKKDKQRD